MRPDDLPYACEIPTTLEDHVAFNLYAQRRPRELLTAAGFFFGLAVLLALSSLGGELLARATVPFDDVATLPSLGLHFLRDLAAATMLFAALFALNLLVLAPGAIRRQARRSLLASPAVDPSDPALTEHNACRFDDAGYTRAVPGAHLAYAWPLFTGLVETRDHLFLMSGRWYGVIYPKRGLPPDGCDRLRRIVAAKVGVAEVGVAEVGASGAALAPITEVASDATDPDAITLVTRVTRDDAVAGFVAARRQQAAARAKRPRWGFVKSLVVWFAIFLVTALLVGQGTFERLGPSPETLAIGGAQLVTISVALIVAVVCQTLFARLQMRVVVGDMLRARRDVDPTDPALAVIRHDRLDAVGYTRRTTLDEQFEEWARITDFVETKERFVLVVGVTMGYAFPKRDMTDDAQERFRRFVVDRRESAAGATTINPS